MRRFGFSSDELSMKILILYALDKLLANNSKAATHDELQQLVFLDDNTDYFMFAASLRELVDTQYLIFERANDIDMFKITDAGRSAAETMAAKLPASLRDECDTQVARMCDRKAISAAVSATVTERSREYVVHLQLTDGALLVFDLNLMMSNEAKAKKLLKLFKAQPHKVYQNVRQLLDEMTTKSDD